MWERFESKGTPPLESLSIEKVAWILKNDEIQS
jgi:hypothetical protein